MVLIDAHGCDRGRPEVAKAIRRADPSAMQALQAQGHSPSPKVTADRWLMPPSQVATRQRCTARAAA